MIKTLCVPSILPPVSSISSLWENTFLRGITSVSEFHFANKFVFFCSLFIQTIILNCFDLHIGKNYCLKLHIGES